MTRHPHYPPACPICGASLPHSNPMAWQFHQQQLEKQLFDQVVERAKALGRYFTAEEVLQPIWDIGIELTLQMDDRFFLAYEGSAAIPRLWGLKPQEGSNQ